MKYQIMPIRSDFLEKVRTSGLDDQGQAVEYLRAEGGEPCRDLLRRANVGEMLILASYCPFNNAGPYKEYGPVFILANSNDELLDYSNLPLPKVIETDYLGETFVLKAYCKNERILEAIISSPTNAESDIINFLSNKDVSFIIVRYAAYGCYSFRIERCIQ